MRTIERRKRQGVGGPADLWTLLREDGVLVQVPLDGRKLWSAEVQANPSSMVKDLWRIDQPALETWTAVRLLLLS